MISNSSPLEYLSVFAVIFVAGVLWTVGFGKYVDKVRREAGQHG